MLKMSTKLLKMLVLWVFLLSSGFGEQMWPLNGTIDLSSGFGDYRQGHFHFGLDIRTGGTINKRLVSPVDGYVWRVKTSYTGYGKALYIKGYDGYTYVMGHLSNFAPKIDIPLKRAQIASERYYQDIYFPRDSIRVKQGEFVAYSGKTGTGAPHLHFEKRIGDTTLNPLVHGFQLRDKTPPVFSRLGVQLVDSSSLLPNGRRKIYLDVVPAGKTGQYTLDTVLYLNRPFGFLADCFDKMRPDGMKQAVYQLSLFIDDTLYYRVQFDSIDFETNSAVSLEYDYLEAVHKKKSVRRLFKKQGDRFARSWSPVGTEGIFGLLPSERIGQHTARLVASDAFGNESELTFDFLWGPPGNVFILDSTVRVARDTTDFYFSHAEDYKPLGIDSVAVMLNKGKRWGKSPSISVTPLVQDKFKCRAVGFTVGSAVLRLEVYTQSGAVFHDNLFNGLLEKGTGKPRILHEIIEDGLLITLDVEARKGSDARVELYWKDTLLGIEYPQYFNMNTYICFIPPQKKYARIDRFVASMSKDTLFYGAWSDTVHIIAVGFEKSQEIAVNNDVSLLLGKDNFFEPKFIELDWQRIINRARLQVNSDHIKIMPDAFVCKKPFLISYKIPKAYDVNNRSGLCWLDEENNRWVWLNNTFENNTLTAPSLGGGSFVAVFDFVPPVIKQLSIKNGGHYESLRPAVNFIIEDTLSGIGDDRDIRIEIDGKWQIPEYDPETGWCTSKPVEPLKPGSHHLGIMVTDRAGNLTEQYLNFFVRMPGKGKQFKGGKR